MNRIFLAVCIVTLAISNPARAQDNHSITDFISTIKWKNFLYYSEHKNDFFAEMAKGESPIATVVTCSDSRVQTNMFDPAPEGSLFMVRNLGNQLATAEGSVEYGVHHLHTPVLLFIGHSRCGAISAVSNNYSKEPLAIKHELSTITIHKNLTNLEGVKANVHNQVAAAMLKFDEELKEGKLTVVGALLDIADDAQKGAGKLLIINVNGETDPNKLEDLSNLFPKTQDAAKRSKKNQ